MQSFGAIIGHMGLPQVLLAAGDGNLWIGGEQGVGLWEFDINGPAPVLKAKYSASDAHPLLHVQSLYRDADGDIWVGGQGLARLHFENGRPQWTTFQAPSLLSYLGVSSITEDALGNLWLALSNMGALRVSRHGFTTFNEADGLKQRTVLSVFENHEGNLYAVTAPKHTLHEFGGQRFTAVQPWTPPNIREFGWGESSIALEDRRGEWWLATGEGLVRYPRVARAADLAHTAPKGIYGSADGLPGASIIRLFEDRAGGIWIGLALGIAHWDPKTETFHDFTAQLRDLIQAPPMLHSFAEDGAGHIWLGLVTGGVVRWSAGQFDKDIEGLPAGIVNGMRLDQAGRLWVASSRGGLSRIDQPADGPAKVTRRYTVSQGLASNQLFAVVEDRAGEIYIAGGRGVDRLDPGTGFIHHLDASDGLPPGEVQRLYGDHEGAIWFASNFGLSRFEPAEAREPAAGKPLIHGVRVAGVPALVSDNGETAVDRLDLRAGSDIEISYGNVDFTPARRARFQYRLLPVDSDWRPPTRLLSAEFARLGPATYTFEVRAIDNQGKPDASIATVRFRIPPPLWQRWWFLLLAALTLLSAAHIAYRYRLNQLLAVQQIRTRLAADLHDDLGSGLAEIAILSEVARQNGTDRLMETVAMRARELRSTMGDIVWSVDPARDNLTNVIRRWRQAATASLSNVSLRFGAPPEEETDRIALPPDRRRHLLLLFKEAIANAARHSGAAHVAVEVECAGARLCVRIADDGCGFPAGKAVAGDGLRNMDLRARALNGVIEVRSKAGQGTTVALDVPV